MGFRGWIFLLAIMPGLYQIITLRIIDRKRQEPLPAEVADVYSTERWNTFIAEKHDMRLPLLLSDALSVLLSAFLIFSPFFSWMDGVSENIYIATAVTALVMLVMETVISLPVHYYAEMVVRTKYGLNRKDRKEFFREQLIDVAASAALITVLYLLMTAVFEHLEGWTNGFTLSLPMSCLLAAVLGGGLYLFMLGAGWFSWQVMRKQYTFTDLPEGELRDKILKLTEGAKKKIQRIEVYDESRKSTSKNAFMFRLLNYRSFGIADNFLSENSERQLLGVLSHEAGHLKHRKNALDYAGYAFPVLAVLVFALVLPQGKQIAGVIGEVLKNSFALNRISYVLVFELAGWIGQPLFALFSVFRNCRTRFEEYEADRNAVKEGYGEDLIETFKEMSSDELVDVNPADIIEFLEYDHPGMYHRIRAIHQAMEAQNND